MIKNIIFDIGDVLMFFTWDKYIYNLFNGDPKKISSVNEAIDNTNLWIELDRNIIPSEEIFAKLRDYNRNYRDDIVKTLQNAKDCFNHTDYAIPWIKNLKGKGYRVYFLSNYSHFNIATCPEVLDFIPFMDGGIFSCDVKLIKPDRAIYEKICQKYNLVPEECIFIDDKKENVEAAISYGMQSIQFTSYESTSQLLYTALENNC